MIIGTGIDIVEINRLEDIIKRYDLHFIKKIFTKSEIAYCQNKAKPSQHFAGRFAVKEAVLKVLGVGMGKGIRWKDIEINIDSHYGIPRVKLYNKAKERAKSMGIDNIHISISHTDNLAIAQAIGEEITV
ncbi:MAG: holo-ACP synthase [Nitrospinae bacterium]|nr:holo-ACP synthase [Nitrospinota bacterium]